MAESAQSAAGGLALKNADEKVIFSFPRTDFKFDDTEDWAFFSWVRAGTTDYGPVIRIHGGLISGNIYSDYETWWIRIGGVKQAPMLSITPGEWVLAGFGYSIENGKFIFLTRQNSTNLRWGTRLYESGTQSLHTVEFEGRPGAFSEIVLLRGETLTQQNVVDMAAGATAPDLGFSPYLYIRGNSLPPQPLGEVGDQTTHRYTGEAPKKIQPPAVLQRPDDEPAEPNYVFGSFMSAFQLAPEQVRGNTLMESGTEAQFAGALMSRYTVQKTGNLVAGSSFVPEFQGSAKVFANGNTILDLVESVLFRTNGTAHHQVWIANQVEQYGQADREGQFETEIEAMARLLGSAQRRSFTVMAEPVDTKVQAFSDRFSSLLSRLDFNARNQAAAENAAQFDEAFAFVAQSRPGVDTIYRLETRLAFAVRGDTPARQEGGVLSQASLAVDAAGQSDSELVGDAGIDFYIEMTAVQIIRNALRAAFETSPRIAGSVARYGIQEQLVTTQERVLGDLQGAGFSLLELELLLAASFVTEAEVMSKATFGIDQRFVFLPASIFDKAELGEILSFSAIELCTLTQTLSIDSRTLQQIPDPLRETLLHNMEG